MNDNNILDIKKLNVFYPSNKHYVKDISISFPSNCVVSIIGPPFSGKTALLRSINRLHELYKDIKVTGDILFKGKNIKDIDSIEVRRKIGMIFKEPCVFQTKSIAENILSGYNLNGINLSQKEKNTIVEESLQAVYLWDNLKDHLKKRPDFLTQGEKQRLCIARAIALKPDVLLMDDPTFIMSAYCAGRIEEMIHKYKEEHAIIVVTSNLSQAARISDFTFYMDKGESIEYNETSKLFWNPKDERTEKYISSQAN